MHAWDVVAESMRIQLDGVYTLLRIEEYAALLADKVPDSKFKHWIQDNPVQMWKNRIVSATLLFGVGEVEVGSMMSDYEDADPLVWVNGPVDFYNEQPRLKFQKYSPNLLTSLWVGLVSLNSRR